ncbi:hypothetical protein LX36DRAFT_85747 [Colletotrichum falcatum]|nr:hypothetical protein LX36DRAFT_85747 [Colletotrichum falcatum]
MSRAAVVAARACVRARSVCSLLASRRPSLVDDDALPASFNGDFASVLSVGRYPPSASPPSLDPNVVEHTWREGGEEGLEPRSAFLDVLVSRGEAMGKVPWPAGAACWRRRRPRRTQVRPRASRRGETEADTRRSSTTTNGALAPTAAADSPTSPPLPSPASVRPAERVSEPRASFEGVRLLPPCRILPLVHLHSRDHLWESAGCHLTRLCGKTGTPPPPILEEGGGGTGKLMRATPPFPRRSWSRPGSVASLPVVQDFCFRMTGCRFWAVYGQFTRAWSLCVFLCFRFLFSFSFL